MAKKAGVFANVMDSINYALNPDDYRADKELRSRIATNEARQRQYEAAEERYRRPAAPTPTKQPSLTELQNFKNTYGDDPELGPLIDQAIQDALGGSQAAAPAPVQQPVSGATAPRAAPPSPAFSGLRPTATPPPAADPGIIEEQDFGVGNFLQSQPLRTGGFQGPSIQAGTASSLPTVTGEPDDPAYAQLKVGDRYVWNGKVFTKRSN